MARPSVYALLLAAGAGRRFGGDKLLAPLQGRPLVAHVAGTLGQALGSGVLRAGVAVIPAGATVLAQILDLPGLTLIENPRSSAGISSSLRIGVDAIDQSAGNADRAALLVMLADQPWLRLDTVTRLVESWRLSGRSIRPRYAGAPDAPGHPVLVDRSLWPLCRQIKGDAGLRDLFTDQTMKIVDVPGSNPDVDTPLDLQNLEGAS